MKFRVLLVLAAVGASASVFSQTVSVSAERKQRADEITKARLEFAASAAYNPYDSDVPDIKKHCWELVEHSVPKDALTEIDRGLKKDPFNIEMLMARAAAWRELGDTAKADAARAAWMAVADSVLLSGDGKDFASAFRVITVDEEYAALHLLKFETIKQSLVSHGKSQFDVFVVKNPRTGEQSEVYFNIDLPKGWLDHHFADATRSTNEKTGSR